FKMDYAHEEAEAVYGRDPREYLINTTSFEKDEAGNLIGLHTVEVEENKAERKYTPVEGSEKYFEVDMVLIAIGFAGTTEDIFTNFGVGKTERHTIDAAKGFYRTSEEGVFACGDARHGQSLVVTAIAEGREAAREVDFYLMGETFLP
ncbi:FAD-dependent oxidoreductase, partial [Listeria monocytogenes]